MRFASSVLLVLALAAGAAAEDPPKPDTSEQAADKALAAVTAKDDAALKALAAKDDPDPWLVADELLLRGKPDEAEAFARAAPRPDVEKLPEFVASRRGKAPDAAARKALAVAEAGVREKRWADVVAAVDGVATTDDPLVAIRLAYRRGIALPRAQGRTDSAEAFGKAGASAEAIGWLARAANALREQGRSARSCGDFSTAIAAWERRMAVEEARANRGGAAAALADIGMAHFSRDEFVVALEKLRTAVSELAAVGDRAGAAPVLGNIGLVRETMRDYAGALESYEVALREQTALGGLPQQAWTLGRMGTVHVQLGNYAEALGFAQRALEISEKLKDRAGIANRLADLGEIRVRMGDYAEALELQERALALNEQGKDGNAIARNLMELGTIEFGLGDRAKALEYANRALKLYEDMGDRPRAAKCLGNIGSIHERMGDHAKALEFQTRALAIKEELGDAADVALTLTNIGNIHCALGDVAEALRFGQHALDLMKNGGDRVVVAATLGNMGIAHRATGDYAKARDLETRSLRLAEELGDREQQVLALWGLTWTELLAGRPREAVVAGRDAVGRTRGLVRGVSDEQGAGARSRFADEFGAAAAAAVRCGDAGSASFFLESGRAGSLLELLKARDAVVGSSMPPALAQAEKAARADETRAASRMRIALLGGDLAEVATARGDLARAQAAVLDVVGRIQREAKAAASVAYPAADELAVIQSRLATDEALVLYGVCEKQDAAVAVVVTPKDARAVALSAGRDVRKACRALTLDKPNADPAAALAELRKLVVDPLRLGGDVKRLLVSPEAELCFVPFALLVPDRDVVYEPSGTVYGLLRDDLSKRGDGVLALGDPDYSARPKPDAAVQARSAFDLGRLPGTRAEASAVGSVVLLGGDATETRLAAELAKKPRWRAVHLACHGLVDAEIPQRSALAVTPDDASDGFLSVTDVFRMKCPADLVVLSACETGKGTVVRGEGLIGLTRAFMFAGAPRVLVSLWKVDDEATSALMKKFYELWNPKDGNGLGAAAALRGAQEFVRSQDKWKHPRFWAAWVLWGLG